jgi:hypothetical protein
VSKHTQLAWRIGADNAARSHSGRGLFETLNRSASTFGVTGAPDAHLAIDEHHVLFDWIPGDIKVVGREVSDGIADRYSADNLVVLWNVYGFANDVRKSGDQHLDTAAKSASGQREQKRLQEHPDAKAIDVVQFPVHADDAGHRGVVEAPIAGRFRSLS